MDALSDLVWESFVHPARYEDEPLRAKVRGMARDTGFDVPAAGDGDFKSPGPRPASRKSPVRRWC